MAIHAIRLLVQLVCRSQRRVVPVGHTPASALETIDTLGTGSVGIAVLNTVEGQTFSLTVLDRLAVESVASIAGVDVGLDTFAVSGKALHESLVSVESFAHIIVAHVVEKDTVTHGVDGHSSTELTISGLENSGRGVL